MSKRKSNPKVSENQLSLFDENLNPITDRRPLPEIIANKYGFPLKPTEHEGKINYPIHEWIRGVAQLSTTKSASELWRKMKKRLEKAGIESRTWCTTLPYTASDGKRYPRDHADAETLYRITQRMDVNTGLRDTILNYLAKAGVKLDEYRRDPQTMID